MYWYKVKNMLIILFTVLNVFLLSMIIISNISASKREKELSETLISVLRKNEITVADGLLNKEKTKLRVYKIENIVENSLPFAKSLTGGKTEKTQDEAGNTCYISGTKTVYIRSGRFMMKDSAVPETMQTAADIEAAKEFFAGLGVDLSGADCRIEGEKIIFTYKIDGMPVFDRELYAKMYGGALSECGGYLITVLNEEGNESKELFVREALMRFLRDEEREKTPYTVTDINAGYWIIFESNSVSFKYTDAVPAYEVVTDKGNYYYN